MTGIKLKNTKTLLGKKESDQNLKGVVQFYPN